MSLYNDNLLQETKQADNRITDYFYIIHCGLRGLIDLTHSWCRWCPWRIPPGRTRLRMVSPAAISRAKTIGVNNLPRMAVPKGSIKNLKNGCPSLSPILNISQNALTQVHLNISQVLKQIPHLKYLTSIQRNQSNHKYFGYFAWLLHGMIEIVIVPVQSSNYMVYCL